MRKLLEWSLNNQLPIEIIYTTGSRQFTKRKIIVKHVTLENIGAYCYLRHDIRTFRLQNILAAAKVLNDTRRTIS